MKFTISLRKIRLLHWCFEIPKAYVSQDKTVGEWSTKAHCSHFDELKLCLTLSPSIQYSDNIKRNPTEKPRLPKLEKTSSIYRLERTLGFQASQTLWLLRPNESQTTIVQNKCHSFIWNECHSHHKLSNKTPLK